jgi:hypothetical protein
MDPTTRRGVGRLRFLRGFWLGLSLLVSLEACSREHATGPAPMAWDRDTCERCNMVIGDRRFATEVRTGHDQRLHKFDDPGCALLWLEVNRSGAGERAEIWVRDPRGERWIDARTARFAGGRETPMEYGFGTVDGAPPDALGLEEIGERIAEMERERRSRRR